MAELIDAREGKRDAFTKATGFSTRLNQLLNGSRAWYLEDVERACSGLGLDLVDFLDSLPIEGQGRTYSVTMLHQVTEVAPTLAAVADEQSQDIGLETDPDFDSA